MNDHANQIFMKGYPPRKIEKMYSSKVRIGNWFEELELRKEKTELYIQKRENKELLVQKIRELFHNVSRETRLSRNEDYIKFGSKIQLFAPDMPSSRPNGENINYGVVVSATVPQDAIGKISRFGDGSPVVCYPKSTPCTRNTFTIKSADCHNRDGNNLLFGQEFILQLTDSPEKDLYLRSPTPLVDDTRGPRQHNRILLSNIKDCYSIWKVLCWDNKVRFETEGAPFPSSTRVVIAHTMTGECLAVEGLDWYTSIFGIECGISVHTFRDIFKRATAECLWMFITEEIPRGTEERCK